MEMVMMVCEECGKEFDFDSEGIIYQNDPICQECLDKYFTLCIECGEHIHYDDCYYDDDDNAYCGRCFNNYTFTCDACENICNHRYHTRYADYTLCDSCYHDNHICNNCGELVHNDYIQWDGYGNPYCEDCFERIQVIQCYSYKPEPYFCGKSKRFLGVELEVDSGGCDHDNAREIMETLGNDYIYAKHDSSIDDGFELVSHPCTLDFHTNNINWENGLNELSDMGYESHDTDTCGIHVHMNREQFGNTWEEQDLAIAKILYFIERHWDNVVKFSRRTNRQLSDWANRYLSKIDDEKSYSPHEVLDYAKDDGSRYRAVNLCNHSTVEIRIFRGTLKYSSFMAILQFCDLLYDVAEMDLTEVISITWKDFIEMGGKYEEFTTYVAERNLA